MIKKKQLQVELNLPTVAVITGLLKAAKRPHSTQFVEDADADLVRQAVPHWRKGYDYDECIKLAKAASTQSNPAEPDQEQEPTANGKAGADLVLQHRIQQGHSQLEQNQKELTQKATINRAVTDEKKAQTLYWQLRTVAAFSPQVQDSEEVTEARDLYFQVASGGNPVDINAEVLDVAAQLGFFEGGDIDPNFLLADGEDPFTQLNQELLPTQTN